MPFEQILGIIAGLLTSVSAIPQIVKIIKEKEAKDVSLKMLIILLAGVGLWIVYGSLKNDWVLIATNGLSFLLNAMIFTLRIIYGKK